MKDNILKVLIKLCEDVQSGRLGVPSLKDLELIANIHSLIEQYSFDGEKDG